MSEVIHRPNNDGLTPIQYPNSKPSMRSLQAEVDELRRQDDEITAQLAEKVNNTDLLFKKDSTVTKVKYPPEIQSHLLPINIYNNAGKFVTDFNPKTLKPVRSTIYYVNPVKGLDTNDGLTANTAFKSIHKALSMTGDIEIRLASGVYYYNDGWKGIDPARGISVVTVKGKAILSNSAYPRRWTESATHPGVFTGPSVYNGESLSAVNNDIRFLVKGYDTYESGGMQLPQSSQTAIEGGAIGRLVGGTNTIVRLPNNLDPNIYLDIKYAKDNVICKANGKVDSTIYLEGIEAYYGATSPMIIQTSTNNSKVIMVNVGAYESRGTDGLELTCNGLTILWGVEASDNFQDGINYYTNHGVSGSTKLDCIEIECRGHNNGKDNTGTNNDGLTPIQYPLNK